MKASDIPVGTTCTLCPYRESCTLKYKDSDTKVCGVNVHKREFGDE